MSKKLFVGVDFSKKDFDVAVLKVTDTKSKPSFVGENTFENSADGAYKLMTWLSRFLPKKNDFSSVLVGGENTWVYSEVVPEVLYEQGIDCAIGNPYVIKSNAGKVVRGKSDQVDAKRIALYFYNFRDDIHLFEPDRLELKELREAYAQRKELVKDKTQICNRLENARCDLKNHPQSTQIKRHVESLERQLDLYKEEIEMVDKEIKQIIEKDDEMKSINIRLTSIPGIGKVTSAMLIIVTKCFTRFQNARQLASFCGVAPFPYQSGTSIQHGNHRSKYADPYLSGILEMTAITAMTHNGLIRSYKERMLKRGKPKKLIINNIKNKLLAYAFAVVKNNTPYDPNYVNPKIEFS